MSSSSNVESLLRSDIFIEMVGQFFECNALHSLYGWNFEDFLYECAKGNMPYIPHLKGNPSIEDTFDESVLNLS